MLVVVCCFLRLRRCICFHSLFRIRSRCCECVCLLSPSRPRPRRDGSLALLAPTLTRPTVRASPRLARCIIIRIGTGTYHRSLRGVARMPLSIVSIQLYINQLIFVHPSSVSTSFILISEGGSRNRLRARSVNTACFYCTRMLTSMTGRHGN